jgi:tetratricopeptide (TPR) repeat protein
MRLEDWASAASVLEAFRKEHPDHALARDATQQLALVYQKQGELAHAAAEYERVAAEAEDPALRGEALLVAGDLYEKAGQNDRALAIYLAYVKEFPEPIETAAETRFRIAGMNEAAHDEAARREQLRQIVALDASAGSGRTPRVRALAARSALVLAEVLYREFGQVELRQPFEVNLQEKQRRMDAALAAFEALVDYEVGEVTAAATFYMAEIYHDFGQALIGSERPAELTARERTDYDAALEEEAFPFEEKAIAVHAKNLELMSAGVFNGWTEKSLGRLADLMPGRYAKFEASSGYLDPIGAYAYRPPRPAAAAPDASQVAGEAAPAGAAAPPANAADDAFGEAAAEVWSEPPPAGAGAAPVEADALAEEEAAPASAAPASADVEASAVDELGTDPSPPPTAARAAPVDTAASVVTENVVGEVEADATAEEEVAPASAAPASAAAEASAVDEPGTDASSPPADTAEEPNQEASDAPLF